MRASAPTGAGEWERVRFFEVVGVDAYIDPCGGFCGFALGCGEMAAGAAHLISHRLAAVPAIHFGMIATGDHRDFGFAARGTTLKGKPLGRCGHRPLRGVAMETGSFF